VAITVIIETHTGEISRPARIDERASVVQLIPAIITALKLPLTDDAGRLITYYLSYNGRRLQEDETLASAGVQAGENLTMVAKMIADSYSSSEFITSPFLNRFTILEKGAETSSKQLKRVERTLSALQIALHKIQITIGEALTDSSGGKGSEILDRFTTLEKGAETSSEQLKRVEKILSEQQRALHKIQMTIGEALTGSGGGTGSDILELVGPRSTDQQEVLLQTSEAPEQRSYPGLSAYLAEEVRTILAQSEEREVRPDKINSLPTFQIRIMDEPLTAHNLSIIFSCLHILYTKCFLITHGRFSDLIEYAQTRTDRFALETNFLITDITHNSPFNFDLSLNPESVARAMQLAIDAVSLAGLRKKEQELTLQARELDIRRQEQEVQIKEENDKVMHQRELQETEFARQQKLLELEKQQFELEKQRFEFHTMRIGFALETAERMVDLLHPETDEAIKTMLVQTLLPDLLQLSTSRGLQLALSPPQLQSES